MGQWALRADGSWDWDRTPADPSVTRILSAYAGGSPMPEHVSRDIYDPTLGSDGGGRYTDPVPVPAIDPHDPVDHVDQLGPGHDGPEYWTGSAPVAREMPIDEYEALIRARSTPWAVPRADLVGCPTCGTGVHPDRLRD